MNIKILAAVALVSLAGGATFMRNKGHGPAEDATAAVPQLTEQDAIIGLNQVLDCTGNIAHNELNTGKYHWQRGHYPNCLEICKDPAYAKALQAIKGEKQCYDAYTTGGHMAAAFAQACKSFKEFKPEDQCNLETQRKFERQGLGAACGEIGRIAEIHPRVERERPLRKGVFPINSRGCLVQ